MFSNFTVAGGTGLHKGDRDYQQDQVGLWQHPKGKQCLLALVADGMGGRSGGRKASDQVLMTAQQLFERFAPESDDPETMLKQLVAEAHTVIRLTAVSSEQEPHSTLAGFLVVPGGACHLIHSGDSRVYHIRAGRMAHRTKDDSYVQTLVNKGLLTPEQAHNHPQSNVLVSCLGTEVAPVPNTHTISDLQAGDTLMACSDGVWHYFSERELTQILDCLSPREACQTLIEQARQRAMGHGDNLSVVVVKLGQK
jgi:PPM family protein phosphatase